MTPACGKDGFLRQCSSYLCCTVQGQACISANLFVSVRGHTGIQASNVLAIVEGHVFINAVLICLINMNTECVSSVTSSDCAT